MKELIIKISPVLKWKPIKSSDDEASIPRWQGVADTGRIIFTMEKEYSVYYLYGRIKKEVGVFNKLKNAKACAELLYNG